MNLLIVSIIVETQFEDYRLTSTQEGHLLQAAGTLSRRWVINWGVLEYPATSLKGCQDDQGLWFLETRNKSYGKSSTLWSHLEVDFLSDSSRSQCLKADRTSLDLKNFEAPLGRHRDEDISVDILVTMPMTYAQFLVDRMVAAVQLVFAISPSLSAGDRKNKAELPQAKESQLLQ